MRSRRGFFTSAARFGGAVIVGATLAAQGRNAQADDHAGFVKRLQGTAQATIGRLARSLQPGALVRVGERIETGPDARIQLMMTDGTAFTLGAESSMVINTVPTPGDGPAVIKLIRGAFLAVTGALTASKWNALTITTDHAVIGVRGTTVWSEMTPEKLGVLLFEGSSVRVENAQGAVDLSEPLDGTDVRAGSEPTAPKTWGAARIDASRAKVAFE